MKIGILTLHLPFNYGNALQQFSLFHYLVEQGYETEMLSHWYAKDRKEISFWHQCLHGSFVQRVKFFFHCCTWSGVFTAFRREAKVLAWMDSNFTWSKETGYADHFPSESLSHDVVIVGSDQVWNPIHHTSKFFLLHTFPDSIRKIAYAASLGSDRFPEAEKVFFGRALQRFEALSVREASAKKILEQNFDVEATLVCDPTLLHSREEWIRLLGLRETNSTARRRGYMLYLVTPEAAAMWRSVRRLAKQLKAPLHVYCFVGTTALLNWRRHPVRQLVSTLAKRVLLFTAGVRLHFTATPTDFVQSVMDCEGLFTDSFHGMMFATLFGKKCNVVIGEHPERQQMSARLRNFVADFGNPEIVTPMFAPDALRPLAISKKLQELIDTSKKWLAKALQA